MVKVKICGITNLEDALHAVDCGADELGFNFYEQSPRYIAPGVVNDIVQKLPRRVATVGVFVNSSLAEIDNIYKRTSVGKVQLHGDETLAIVERLMDFGTQVIKAIRVSKAFDHSSLKSYTEDEFYSDMVEFLLDAQSGSFGGSGQTFDWALAVKFKEIVPEFYLAGGLTPKNVVDAVRFVKPTAVDVASGVETSPGKKDPKKVKAFIENAKNA